MTGRRVRPSTPKRATSPRADRAWWRDYLHDRAHGPLPALLLALTVSTGLVDAVSILSLGRVFVANMTGNVVFVGFAFAHAPGFSLAASLIALAAFLLGARVGGALTHRTDRDRGSLLAIGVGVELLLLVGATMLSTLAAAPLNTAWRDTVVALIALALGVQNAVVRRLAVPDLTTSVSTMTLTGIAADLRTGNPRAAFRRALSVAAMLIGAVVGAIVVLHAGVTAALWVASTLITLVFVGAQASTRRAAPWRMGDTDTQRT